MKSYQLHLIRHGLTQGNLDGLYVGSGTDLPLCEQGRADLLDLRARFAYPQPDTVFCSPMRRAVETADTLTGGGQEDGGAGSAGDGLRRV